MELKDKGLIINWQQIYLITLRVICLSIAFFALFTIINYADSFGILAALQSLDMLMITLFLSAVAFLLEGLALLLVTALAIVTCQIV